MKVTSFSHAWASDFFRAKGRSILRLPTVEEVAAIVGATDPAYPALTASAAYAGLRLGEAAALQLGDLQLGDLADRPVLKVSRQVQRAGAGVVEIRPPKCGSERSIAIHGRLATILKEHAMRYAVTDPNAFLFTTLGGHPPHQNTVGYAHAKACNAAGLPWVNFHRLRHFYASGLIRQGMTVVEVQRALGHVTARETMATYAHIWNDTGERIRDASGHLFSDAGAD